MTAEEGGSPRSPNSPDGKALRGREAMVQLVMALDEDSGCPGERLIRTTSALLKTHLEKWEKERGSTCRPEDCPMNPLEFFCHVQARNAANEISVRITEMNLTYLHIRELLQSLFALVTFLRPKSIESAKFFCCNYLQVLVPIVQDMECKLAQFDKAPAIDWDTAVKRVNTYDTRFNTTAVRTIGACSSSTLDPDTSGRGPRSDNMPFAYYVPPLSDFEIGKILGRGSFGAVYEAKYRGELQCAIKVSMAPALQGDEGTLKRELSLIDKVVASVVSNHPFVVRFLACFVARVPGISESEGSLSDLRAYLTVMDLVQGVDLSVFATRFRLCGRELAVHIVGQLAMAIEHFHLCGLIHRDIKLSNIMILQNGRVKLIDFDVSKICIAHFSRIYSLSYFRRTCAEFRIPEKIGTAAYMAPELHLGQRFGRAIDWWSLGVVGHRLFLGRLPFRGTTEKMVDQITNQNLDWNSSSSKVPGTKDAKARSIKEFLAGMLRKSPLNRLGSRTYDDIFGHEVFSGLDWERLPRKDFDCPPLRELVGQANSAGNRVCDEDNAVMDGACMKQGRRLKPPSFQDLEDLPGSEHVKLYTFISATVKNLIARNEASNDFLDEPPSVRHITKLCRKGICEDSLSGEVGQACELAPTKPDTVKFVCDMQRRKFLPCRRSPVLFEQMPGVDGQQKLIVRKVNNTALISTLYEGDVIARIAGADASAWDSRSAESLFAVQSCVPIEVIADNAFRFAKTSSLVLDELRTRFGVISIDFVQADKSGCPLFGNIRKWSYGFECRALEYWSLKTMGTSRVIVVGRFDLHKQQTSEASAKLFFGDVILSVNEEVEVDSCLKALKGRREVQNIKAVPCSPLRNALINLIAAHAYRCVP